MFDIEEIIKESNKKKDKIITLRAYDDFESERVSDKIEIYELEDRDGIRNLAIRDGGNLIKIPVILIQDITKEINELDGNEEVSFDIKLPRTKFKICVC